MKRGHSFQTEYAVHNYASTRNLWDVPIFESPSFAVLPTVGALVEGWLLVVPNTPKLSFAKLSTSELCELETFLADIVPVIESNYGAVSIFEHGPSMAGSCVGCGVDYAHLHLVPTRCNLLAGAKKLAPNIRWNQIVSLNEIQNHPSTTGGYWFLKQDYRSDISYLGICENGKPTSQLFRRVIAADLDCISYDWKLAVGKDKIAATVRKLTGSLHLA